MRRKPAPPPQALEYQTDALALESRPLPFPTRIVLYAAMAVLASGAVWAAVSEVDQIVTARGRIVSTRQIVVPQPLETARIQTIHVEVGDRVRDGDLLISFDPTFATADAAGLRSRFESLDAQAKRLLAELDGRHFEPPATPDGSVQGLIFAARPRVREPARPVRRAGQSA
ncbi:MAG: hypothetical protein HC888_06175 [Candidatus Competibacteraceae bacterium]|nr:hypothetical protein [Candidatus Competibacteraceae bacterium]